MKIYLRLLMGMMIWTFFAPRAAAQDGDAGIGAGMYLKFSLDLEKYYETGVSAISADHVFGYNYGLDFQMHSGEAIDMGKFYASPKQNAYEPDPLPAKKWRPGIYGDLQYISKGAKFDGQTSHSNYLELTVFGEVEGILGEGEAFFRLGPYFGYGIGGKTGSGADEVSTFGGQNGFRRFDAGASIGLGYKFSFGGVVYLCYELGLVNRAPATNGGFPTDYKDYTRSIGLNFAYPVNKIINAFKAK